MNSKELQQIIKCGETSTVQFKESFSNQDSIAAEMVAMSNAQGGIIVFGIKDKTGEIAGLSYQEIQRINYRDSKDITGTLPELFEKGMSFLKANLHNIQAGQGFNSIGKLEISEIALEEILQNALVHRDYTRNAPIRLLIFDNRIEIISPGCLPDGQTVENIKLGSAVMRNPFIANFCSKTMPYRGLGSGIIRALQEEPGIKFTNDAEGMQFISVMDRIIDEGINEGINETEALILDFLNKKPGAKGHEISSFIGKGTATTERYLKSLKDKGLIIYKGSRKTGGYYKI